MTPNVFSRSNICTFILRTESETVRVTFQLVPPFVSHKVSIPASLSILLLTVCSK